MKVALSTAELPTDAARTVDAGPRTDPEPLKPEGTVLYGMQMQSVTREAASRMKLSATGGVLVVTVEDDSPAARALIKPRDVITAVDEEPVKDVVVFRDLVKKGDLAKGIALHLERIDGRAFALLKAN